MGISEVMEAVVEKLKEAILAMENLFGQAMAWFDHVFPPETRADQISHWIHVALPFLVAAVVLTVILCLCYRCCCGCGGGGRHVRMMKAPGRNCRMPRSDFESNPRGYFRNLRSYPGDQLC